LQVDESGFQIRLQKIVAAVRAGEIHLIEASYYEQGVQRLTRDWWLEVYDRADQNVATYERFARKTYMYHFYLLSRAHKYAVSTRDRIDPNDCEDARLCLHLGSDDDFTAVVTNDAGLQHCVRAGLQELNATAEATRHTPLQIWDATEMVDRLSRVAPAR
jgi:hypothetical protein